MKICKCKKEWNVWSDSIVKDGLYKYDLLNYSQFIESKGSEYFEIYNYYTEEPILIIEDEKEFKLHFEDLYESRIRKIKLLYEDL